MIATLTDLRLITLIDKKEMIMEIVTTNITTERRKSATGEIPDKDYPHREPKSLTATLLV